MTLPLWLFALVWLAAWAACWFLLARIWPVRARTEMLPAPPGYGWHLGRTVISRGPHPSWSPFVATLCAFLADLVATVLA